MESDSDSISTVDEVIAPGSPLNNVVIDDDCFKILIATDIHLGYKESDHIRGEDTFRTFEEILQIGAENSVDFILLGGDLFHDTKPSPYCINQCIRLLRKYCLGDQPVGFEIISDQKIHFDHTLNKVANYEDPNLNVGIPVFSIHGNHDDPTGKNRISAMDLMASTGLVNYFGRWEDLTKVEMSPILLKKGGSIIALYGLSHISDQRLGRLFLQHKVTLARPDNIDSNDIFNLLVIHQNRAARGPKNYIPVNALPKGIDLVMWGHEHDCRITPEAYGDLSITQPGSSVATSLAAGEAIPKKVGILKIRNRKFSMCEITLSTVRPFMFDDVMLDFLDVPRDEQLEKSKMKIMRHVETMIEEAHELKRTPEGMLPLIRLRAHYTNEAQIFNAIKFGQQYVGRVANPEDILKFVAVSTQKRKTTGRNKNFDDEEFVNTPASKVEDLIIKYLENHQLSVITANGLTQAVMKSIVTNDADAPADIINHQFKKTFDKLKELSPECDEVDACLDNLREMRTANNEEEEVNQLLNKRKVNRRAVEIKTESDDDAATAIIDDDDEDADTGIGSSRASTTVTPRPTRGRGSRGGKKPSTRGSRGKARA